MIGRKHWEYFILAVLQNNPIYWHIYLNMRTKPQHSVIVYKFVSHYA